MADYCHISFNEVLEQDYFYHLFLLREAFIYNMMQSESGKEYLRNAYRLQITSPDKEKLRNKFKK